jgi:2-hydroxychromene-2-carboxylate isomerase
MTTGKTPLQFWFDFISPYGYLASLRIDEIAARHGRTVDWHPVLLGVTVLKVMGLPPLMETPLKKDYAPREIARYTRRHGVTLGRPLSAPPMHPLPAARLFAWLLRHAPVHARPWARGALHDHWVANIDVDQTPALVACGLRCGIPRALLDAGLSDPAAATLLRAEVDAAVAQGVFGSPFVIIDGEPFFGVDKLELIDDWLARGGW